MTLLESRPERRSSAFPSPTSSVPRPNNSASHSQRPRLRGTPRKACEPGNCALPHLLSYQAPRATARAARASPCLCWPLQAPCCQPRPPAAAAAAMCAAAAPPGDGAAAPAPLSHHARAVARNAAASTLGASVVALVVTPLDVMKVRMQAHVCPVGGVVPCADPGHVGGMRDALRKVVRADGVRGLWRGLSVTLALAVPTTGLYFSIYEAFMARAAAVDGMSDGAAAVLSGASARVVTATVASPVELARVRVQAGDRHGVVAIVQQVYRRDGAKALWRGLGPTLVRDAPFSAIYWGAYEMLKDPARSPLPAKMLEREHKFAGYLMSGVGAGGLAAVLTVPADVIKTRRQALVASAGDRGPSGTYDIARAIYKEEGPRGLLRGVGPRVVKVAPACAIMMGTYELFKVILQ